VPRRGFSPRGRSGAVHNKEWTAACIDTGVLDLAIGVVAAFSMFVADEAETILRTRGRFRFLIDAATTNESATIAMGIGVVSARAVAAGAASLPRPATEGAFPWLFHDWAIVTSFAGLGSGPGESFDISVDSKAMRKIKETEVLALVFEVCESTDNGGNVRVDGGLRVLTGD